MARAFASIVIDAPVETVWAIARDFSAIAQWVPGLGAAHIEDGLPPDAIGCIRAFSLGDGTLVRERLLALDDARYTFSYNFETPAFPVTNYVAVFEAIPVTSGDRCYVRWWSDFDEAPSDAGKYVDIISRAVFGGGLASLARHAAGKPVPAGAPRWQGLRPAKVFCSSTIAAPVAEVWGTMRDFAGMGRWHEDVRDMHMLAGARGDQVSAVRDFSMNDGHLLERLTLLSDTDMSFRYTIDESAMPWRDYHAGARLYPVTSNDTTFAVWTADWVASPNDDVTLIPAIHADVFQKAFDTLDAMFRRAPSA